MKSTYEPKTPFEAYVMECLSNLEEFDQNHLAHHRNVYGRLWWVAGALFASILGLYIRG